MAMKLEVPIWEKSNLTVEEAAAEIMAHRRELHV